jgi:hypothetical protein
MKFEKIIKTRPPYDKRCDDPSKNYGIGALMLWFILKEGECYYDGSSLRGRDDNIAENYIKHGDNWIWEYLEKEWNRRFG